MSDKKIYDTILKKKLIQKGWSGDTKYCVTTYNGIKYLLRVMPIEKHEAWKNLFVMLERVATLGIPMCKPIEFGTCEDGVYALFSWIDGEILAEVLPNLPEAEQYKLGVKAGEVLHVVNSIPAPENEENWTIKFNRLIDSRINKYYECEQNRVEGTEHFIRYIEQNRKPLKILLKTRPQCFLHDDYSTHNMMFENGELRILDFDRYKFGDPWYEFYKSIFSAQISPHFSTGQIHGYFYREPPEDFFRLLAFYASTQLLTAITFAIPYGQEWVDSALNSIADVLKWFDNMNNLVPSWYFKDYK